MTDLARLKFYETKAIAKDAGHTFASNFGNE